MRLDENMAEFIGAHVGDGSLYKTNTGKVWEIRGNLNEGEYYNHLSNLVFKLFNINIYPKFRKGGKNGVIGLRSCNKTIINTLIEFGFNPGSKVYTVSVPEYIFKSNSKIKKAFVRGLFDTDGCLNFFKANKSKHRNYPRIVFGFASVNLRDSLKRLLDSMMYRSYVYDYKKNYSLVLAGKDNLGKWTSEIKPKNPKFLKNINNWRNRISNQISPFRAGIA